MWAMHNRTSVADAGVPSDRLKPLAYTDEKGGWCMSRTDRRTLIVKLMEELASCALIPPRGPIDPLEWCSGFTGEHASKIIELLRVLRSKHENEKRLLE